MVSAFGAKEDGAGTGKSGRGRPGSKHLLSSLQRANFPVHLGPDFPRWAPPANVPSLLGAVLTMAAIWLLGRFVTDEYALPVDIIYLYPIIAGLVGYLFGRSRKGAFVAAVLGLLTTWAVSSKLANACSVFLCSRS